MAARPTELALDTGGSALLAPERAPKAAIVSDPLRCGLLGLLDAAARRCTREIHGLEHIAAVRDPFIVAINHSNRSEAVLVPALMIAHRAGKLIHFLADWNYRLIPGIGLIYRSAETISVMRKPARPDFLNLLKPLYMPAAGPLRSAQRILRAGNSVGVFPEGKINVDRNDLMPGFRGAAFLSLATRAPIVPVGIRFPLSCPQRAISDFAPMDIFIGASMTPPRDGIARPTRSSIRAWHATVMHEIARLSGKRWPHSEEFLQRREIDNDHRSSICVPSHR